jgi:hypothetical protein
VVVASTLAVVVGAQPPTSVPGLHSTMAVVGLAVHRRLLRLQPVVFQE